MSNITVPRALLQQALEFVTSKQWGTTPYMDVRVYEDAARLRDDLRAALAQQEQEPDLRNANPIGLTPPQKALQQAQFRADALAQQEQEPVAMLWKVRKALALASAICDRVPNRWHHTHEIGSAEGDIGDMVNAHPDGTHGYRLIQEAEAELVAYLTTPVAAPPRREWVSLTEEEIVEIVAECAASAHRWDLRSKNNG